MVLSTLKQSKLIVGLVVFGLLSIFQLQTNYLPIAVAASPYASKPSDVEDIKNKISNSLFSITYRGKIELAFAGGYNFATSFGDQGYNNLLVTSRDFISDCYLISTSQAPLSIELTYKNSKYKGTCWGYASGSVDMATVATPFKTPTLNLWDSYLPKTGGWLIAAYYVPGFGITFRETAVAIYNKETFVLGVEKFAPEPLGSALLFNQNGSFVGILTTKGVGTVPREYFKVHGAPLQCSPAGTTDDAITNCSTRKSTNESAQSGVWTIDDAATPKPTPTPSPSVSAVDASLEVRDTHVAALTAYKLYTDGVVSCLKAFQGRNPAERRVLALVSSSQICASENSKAKAANERNLALGRTISSSRTSSELISLLDQFNDFTDTFNLALSAMDDAILMADNLSQLASEFDEIEKSLFSLNSEIEELDSIIRMLPTKVSNLITKGIAFDYLEESREVVSDVQSQFDDAVGEIERVTYPDPEAADNLAKSLVVIKRILPSESTFKRTVQRAYDAIPAFYCKRGKSVALPKKGKCVSGFSKITIDKGSF
jgi:hypothetical protein